MYVSTLGKEMHYKYVGEIIARSASYVAYTEHYAISIGFRVFSHENFS